MDRSGCHGSLQTYYNLNNVFALIFFIFLSLGRKRQPLGPLYPLSAYKRLINKVTFVSISCYMFACLNIFCIVGSKKNHDFSHPGIRKKYLEEHSSMCKRNNPNFLDSSDVGMIFFHVIFIQAFNKAISKISFNPPQVNCYVSNIL